MNAIRSMLVQWMNRKGTENRKAEKERYSGGNAHKKEGEHITDSLIKNHSVHEYYIRRGAWTGVILVLLRSSSYFARRRNDFLGFFRVTLALPCAVPRERKSAGEEN